MAVDPSLAVFLLFNNYDRLYYINLFKSLLIIWATACVDATPPFVAVELKIGKFKPEYAGKMQFYLDALDEKKKLDEENPSVGLVLCKSKDEEVVRIAISKAATSVKVATYKTKIIDRKLLKNKLHSLPWVEEYE